MKKYTVFLIIIISFFIFISPSNAEELKIHSNNAILYNLNDNSVLYEKNKDQKVAIASLTKMMTAIVSLENIENLEENVKFEKSDYVNLIKIDAAGSSLNHQKSYTYNDLLYALVLESGADCANALARLTKGNEENFVKAMNEKAKELGMKNTSFANPIGMDDENNYSTVNDLSILVRYGLKNKDFKKLITTMEYELNDKKKIYHTISFYAKNACLDMPYIKGGKTGHEIKAKYALATIAYKNNTLLMLITTKAENNTLHVKDAKKLYDYYFNNYSYQTIISKDKCLTYLKSKYTNEKKFCLKSNEDIKIYVKNNYDKNMVKTKYIGPKTIDFSTKYKDQIGQLEIYYGKKLIKTELVFLNQKLTPSTNLIILASLVYLLTIISTVTIIYRIKKK